MHTHTLIYVCLHAHTHTNTHTHTQKHALWLPTSRIWVRGELLFVFVCASICVCVCVCVCSNVCALVGGLSSLSGGDGFRGTRPHRSDRQHFWCSINDASWLLWAQRVQSQRRRVVMYCTHHMIRPTYTVSRLTGPSKGTWPIYKPKDGSLAISEKSSTNWPSLRRTLQCFYVGMGSFIFQNITIYSVKV